MTKKDQQESHFYWTANDGENLDKLKKLYPTAPWDELLKVFVGKNRQAIVKMANTHGVKRMAQDGWNESLDEVLKKGFEASQDSKLAAEGRGALKIRLITEINRIGVKGNLRPKTWATILRHANLLGLSWGASEATVKNGDTPAKNLWEKDILLAFLVEKRTAKELEKHFSEPIAEIEKKLPSTMNNHELTSYRAIGGGRVYFYRERPRLKGEIQPRSWTSILPKTDEGEVDDGSIIVKFPAEIDWREIRIIVLDEAYFGSSLYEEKRFESYLALGRQQYCHFIINGSLFALPPRGKMEDKVKQLYAWRDELMLKLRPMAHKILWAHQGCTEAQLERSFNFDPLEDVCRELGIPYFKRPVIAVVTWRGRIFTFYCIHGTTTAKKRGSMINAVTGLLDQFEKVDFFVMSHQMSGMENVVPRRIRDRVNFCITDKNQHLIITPSFRKYEGSIEERKGQALPARGSCAMILFPDGACASSD